MAFDPEALAGILLKLKDCSGPQAELTYCLGIDMVVEDCLAELKRLDYTRPSDAEPEIHQCCGCSCDVCAHGHNWNGVGQHTAACVTRYYEGLNVDV